ncbi:MAG: hypothetical protein NTV50_06780 [Planctomycetota bacterium]|nr:hypothetical protein [Planctomycetota bacterium]
MPNTYWRHDFAQRSLSGTPTTVCSTFTVFPSFQGTCIHGDSASMETGANNNQTAGSPSALPAPLPGPGGMGAPVPMPGN